jgi:hypothetical protein
MVSIPKQCFGGLALYNPVTITQDLLAFLDFPSTPRLELKLRRWPVLCAQACA